MGGISPISFHLPELANLTICSQNKKPPHPRFSWSSAAPGHFLLNRWDHLEGDSSYLAQLRNRSNDSFITVASTCEAWKNMRLTSANRRFETPGLPLAILIGVSIPLETSLLRMLTWPSAAKRNKYGLKGSPLTQSSWGGKVIQKLTLQPRLVGEQLLGFSSKVSHAFLLILVTGHQVFRLGLK